MASAALSHLVTDTHLYWVATMLPPQRNCSLQRLVACPWLTPSRGSICPEICHLDLISGPQNPIFPLHQGTGNHRAQARSSPHLFCMAHKLRIVFTFLNSWGKKTKEEEHSMTQEHARKLEFQCPSIKLYGDTVTPIHVCIVSGCFSASKAEASSSKRDRLRPMS